MIETKARAIWPRTRSERAGGARTVWARRMAGRGAKRTVSLWLSALAAVAMSASAVELAGRVTHGELSEISGIVKSSYGDFYWVHNDSGDVARIYAIDADSRPVKPPYLRISADEWPGHRIDNAWHTDWEDIALADGVLYLADVGNNGNARRDLGVYAVNEADPRAIATMRALKFIPIRYPDQRRFPAEQWHFDCEAVFAADGKLYFLTKHRRPGVHASWEAGVKLYRLDTQYVDRENVLTLVGRREDVLLATGADLSPDGARLAVATYSALWIFDRPEAGDNWLAGDASRLDLNRGMAKQLEAITWEDAATLRLINEQRDVMRARVSEFAPVP